MGLRLIYLDSDILAGTERHVLDLLGGLRERGEPVALAAGRSTPVAEQAAAEGHERRHLEKRSLIDWRAIRKLARWLRRGEVDLIHAHNGRTALQAVLARHLARRGTIVLTQHFIAPSRTRRRGAKRRLSDCVHRRMSRGIDHFIAISTAVRDAMLERGDCAPEQISVIANGINDPGLEPQRPAAAVRAALELPRPIPADAPLIVCAARLQAEKDVASLVAAMAHVVRREPRARCVIAGEGAERPALEQRIRALGLEAHVHLLGFRRDVRAIMAAGDLFALPARAEGFGLVLIEAMALGKPTVAAAAGGPLDIVEPDHTGLLVEPGDDAALAEAILQLIADEPARQRMGQAARQRFESRFTAAAMARATAAVYARALGAEPHAQAPAPLEAGAAD